MLLKTMPWGAEPTFALGDIQQVPGIDLCLRYRLASLFLLVFLTRTYSTRQTDASLFRHLPLVVVHFRFYFFLKSVSSL